MAPLGEDAVLGDPEAQSWGEHQKRRQQQMEVLPESSAAQEVGRQVRQDHQQRVEEHPAQVLFLRPNTFTPSGCNPVQNARKRANRSELPLRELFSQSKCLPGACFPQV